MGPFLSALPWIAARDRSALPDKDDGDGILGDCLGGHHQDKPGESSRPWGKTLPASPTDSWPAWGDRGGCFFGGHDGELDLRMNRRSIPPRWRKKERSVGTLPELEKKRLLVQAAGKKIKGETSRLGGEARDTMKPYIEAMDSYLAELSEYLKALSKE